MSYDIELVDPVTGETLAHLKTPNVELSGHRRPARKDEL